MKKFRKFIPFLILALLVMSLSGCGSSHSSIGGSSSSNTNSNTNTNTDTNTDTNTNNNSTNTNTNTNTNTEVVDTTNASATISTRDDGVIQIVLSTGNETTTAADALTVQNFVWHVSPDHAGEYWTNEDGESFDEDGVLSAVTSQDGIYIARDIRYVPSYLEFSSTTVNKEQSGEDKCFVSYYRTNADGVDTANKYILAALPADNNDLSTVKASMTHDPSDAYEYPVLHITKPGSYDISGTWQGQIWVDIPDKSVHSDIKTKKDPDAQVVLILNGLDVNCGVAPALVFKKVFQCSEDIDESSEVSALITSDNYSIGEKLADTDNYYAGAVVLLAAGTTNTFTGTNVARLNNVEINDDYEDDANATSYIGQFVKAQDKMYKLDAAFHSRMSIVIANETSGSDGNLNITSTNYEGLGSELHMLIDSGNITVSAVDDGLNINEDNISVFTQTGGTLTVTSTGGDGIDSNGYVALKNCTLNITAGSQAVNSAGEAGIDSELGLYGIDTSGNATSGSNVIYNYTASSTSGAPGGTEGPGSGQQPPAANR